MWSKLLLFLSALIALIEELPAQVIGNFSYDYWYVEQNTILHRDGAKFERLKLTSNPNNGVFIRRDESLSNIFDLRSKILYTAVNSLFLKNDTLVASDLKNSSSSTQGGLILPDIWGKDILYVFSQNQFYSDLSYSLYDLKRAAFISKNITLVKNASEQLHSIFIENSFRIVTTDKDGNLITIILDSLGLKKPKFQYKIKTNSSRSFAGAVESIKFSSKGNLIAAHFHSQSPPSIYLYKYDVIRDEACLISYNNFDLLHETYNLDFSSNDSCIYLGSSNSNENVRILEITKDYVLVKSHEINEKGVREFITIPNNSTYFFNRILVGNSLKLQLFQNNNCNQTIKKDTLENFQFGFCLPNIPKVIDSIYPPIDYPCMQPEDIEYIYRVWDEKFVNLITPNNDGYNDFFTITWPDFWKFSEYKVTILNRYGQTMYTSQNINFIWDGYRNSNKVPDGAYYYIIEFNEKILGHKVFTGVINVMD